VFGGLFFQNSPFLGYPPPSPFSFNLWKAFPCTSVKVIHRHTDPFLFQLYLILWFSFGLCLHPNFTLLWLRYACASLTFGPTTRFLPLPFLVPRQASCQLADRAIHPLTLLQTSTLHITYISLPTWSCFRRPQSAIAVFRGCTCTFRIFFPGLRGYPVQSTNPNPTQQFYSPRTLKKLTTDL